jgi:hypothetical protein
MKGSSNSHNLSGKSSTAIEESPVEGMFQVLMGSKENEVLLEALKSMILCAVPSCSCRDSAVSDSMDYSALEQVEPGFGGGRSASRWNAKRREHLECDPISRAQLSWPARPNGCPFPDIRF